MIYKIKEARIKKKMTLEELAEKSGVCKATICRLENGENVTATTATISKLAKALGVNVADIFLP